jgi:hypothetical protein
MCDCDKEYFYTYRWSFKSLSCLKLNIGERIVGIQQGGDSLPRGVAYLIETRNEPDKDPNVVCHFADG